MNDWSISRHLKVSMGSLAGVILLLALGAMAGVFILRSEMSAYREAATLAQAANDIAEDAMEAQIAAQTYRLSQQQIWIDEFEENVAEGTEVGLSLSNTPGVSEELMAFVSRLLSAKDEYSAHFADIVRGEGEKAQIYSEIRTLGLAARETVSELINAANRAGDAPQTFSVAKIQQDLLLGRLYLERFYLSGNETDFTTSTEYIDAALQQVSWISSMERDADRLALMETVKTQLTDFRTASDGVFATVTNQAGRFERIAEDAANVIGFSERMIETISADQLRQANTIESTFAMTAIVMGVGAAFAIGFAILMARSTIGSVGREFDQTLTTVSALADGNLDIDIPGSEKDTELGRIARALEVFRARGKDAEVIRQQSEAAEAKRRADEKEREAERVRLEQERARAEQEAADRRKREIFATLQSAVSGVVGAAVRGDFSQRVDTTSLDAELAGLAEQINTLMANVDSGLAEIARVSERLADGDLRTGMDGHFEGTFLALQQNISSMTDALSEIISGISAEAAAVHNHSTEMASGAEDLSRRAEAQAASLEQTSAAMTQIASSAESNASSASQTDAAASEMRTEARQAGDVLEATVAAMRDIQDGSREIEAIVDVIEDIAFQTNLLSLNASVEAARAGEAGKGFAVVANEVRALAQRSAEASSKVQTIIVQSTSAISRGSDAVGETGETLQRIIERIEIVTDNLREIKSASNEQAVAVKDVSNAFGQLDKITQRNASVAEQTRGTAALLSTQSERMQSAVGRVRVRPSNAGAIQIDPDKSVDAA